MALLNHHSFGMLLPNTFLHHPSQDAPRSCCLESRSWGARGVSTALGTGQGITCPQLPQP